MTRDDRVMAIVRVISAGIVLILILAVIVLYLMPGETDRFWAWTIRPTMTPLLMGAGYGAGAYFFARAFRAASWRSISLGFLPITVFTSFMLIATILHWDRFNHDHIAFFAWTFLYVVTPFLVPALWLLNRGADPGFEPTEERLPASARLVATAVGTGICGLALGLFIIPDSLSSAWPWQLSALTARVTAGFLALTGCSLIAIASDARWHAAKILMQSLILGSALIVAAIPRAWDGLDPSEEIRWAYLLAMVVSLAVLTIFYVRMNVTANRHRSLPSTAPS